MLYDFCIFDLDGTLTDPYDGTIKGILYAMKKLGLGDKLENPEMFIGPPLFDSFRNAFGISDDEAVRTVETFREYYSTTGIYENKMYPGIAQLLESLKSGGANLAVATIKPDKFANIVLIHFDLYKYFDFVAGDSPDGSLSKGGKQELIRIALSAVDPGRKKNAVMIGDRKHDILGAQNAGIDSIGVLWGYGSRAEFEESGATWIAGSTEHLRCLVLGE